MTSQEAMKTKLPERHIFSNVAAVDEQPDWRIVPEPPGWGSNPFGVGCDYTRPTLFGYDQDAFMQWQYK